MPTPRIMRSVVNGPIGGYGEGRIDAKRMSSRTKLIYTNPARPVFRGRAGGRGPDLHVTFLLPD